MPKLSPQSRIGPYLINAEIGQGGMGLVYRATRQDTGQVVAIKLLRQADQERHKQALLDEAITGTKLDHPNCLKSFGVLTYGPEPIPAIVSEYVHGLNLRQFLDLLQSEEIGFRFSPVNATLILEQLFLGLRAAHKAGLIHQDIKPENYLVPQSAIEKLRIAIQDGQEVTQEALFELRDSGWLKLSDWGLSILKERERANNSQSLSLSLSQIPEGKRGGTIVYMPMEQIDGVGISRRTDIFALSLIYYELLTGHPPRNARSRAEGLDPQCFEDLQIYLVQMINSSARSAIDPKKDGQLRHLRRYPRVRRLLQSMSMRQKNDRMGSGELEHEIEDLVNYLEENPNPSVHWPQIATLLCLSVLLIFWLAYTLANIPNSDKRPQPSNKTSKIKEQETAAIDPAKVIPKAPEPVKDTSKGDPKKPNPPDKTEKKLNPIDLKTYSPKYLNKIRNGDRRALREIKQIDRELGRALANSTLALLFLRNVESITEAGARELAKSRKGIYLENLKTISTAEMTELAKFRGFTLTIGFTQEVDNSVFEALARYRGLALSLRYRPRLTKENAKALAAFRGQMFKLRGEAALDSESAVFLAAIKARSLTIQDMKSIDDLTALALSQFSGSLLSLSKVSELSTLGASALAEGKAGALSFGALNSLTPEVAGLLAKFKGKTISVGLEDLEEAVAKELAVFGGVAINFSRLKELKLGVAAVLKNSQAKIIKFSKLERMDSKAAVKLAQFRGSQLAIAGPIRLGPEHALALFQFTGPIIDLSDMKTLNGQFVQKMAAYPGSMKVNDSQLSLVRSSRAEYLNTRPAWEKKLLQDLRKDRSKSLLSMTKMTREVAMELRGRPGQKLVFQSLTTLNFLQAGHLARTSAKSLHFPNLKTLSRTARAALFHFKGEISINGKIEKRGR